MIAAHPSAGSLDSPYVGLSFYTEDDAPLFGRNAERQVIMGNLRASRLTLLYGASGVGKSSLLRAGVAARLRELARHALLEGGAACYVPVVFSAWKDDPVADLAREIEDATRALLEPGAHVALPRTPLRATVEGAVAALEQAATRGGLDAPAVSLLVVLDQFEEFSSIYGALREGGDRGFADELAECLSGVDVPVNFLISIREDAYAALGDLLKGRLSNVYGNYLHLEYLAPEAARDAIEKPIAHYNAGRAADERVSIEPGLIETVLEQVRKPVTDHQAGDAGAPHQDGPAREIVTPYLQLVMTALWRQEMTQESRCLRLATLKELRGAQEIVARHLEDALDDLQAPERELAIDVLHHLVTPSGTKIALEVGDLAAYTSRAPDRVATVMAKLAGSARILRDVPPAPGKSPDDDTARRFEIYHDVLAGPINGEVAEAATRRLEREKLEAEERERRQRRQARTFRALAGGFLILLLLSIAAVIVATHERNGARRAEHVSLSRQLAGQSLTDLSGDALARGVLLSLEAYRVARTSDARAALLRAQRATADMRAYLAGHDGPVRAVAYSPDGRMLATGGQDRTIVIWDPRTARRIAVIPPAHTQGISSLAFSPDGSALASGSADENVMLWNPRTGRRLRTLQGSSVIESVAFSPDGRMLATADDAGDATIWDWRSGARPRTLPGPGRKLFSLAFAPDGRELAAAGRDGVVDVWSTRTGRLLRSLREPSLVMSIAFSPDGRALAISQRRLVVIRRVRSGRTEAVLRRGPRGPVLSVAFNRAGDELAAGSQDQSAVIWRLDAQRRPEVFSGAADAVSTVAFSPDGQTLAAGSDDGRVILWQATLEHPARQLVGHRGPVLGLGFSPDGASLASAGADGRIFLWDARTGRRLGRLSGSHAAVQGIAFSPDGRQLVSGGNDGRLTLWDVATRNRLWTRKIGRGPVWGVAFSPDGRWLATAQENTFVSLRSTATGRRLRYLSGHSDAAYAVAFSPDSRLVASGGNDGRIIIWRASTGRTLRVLAPGSVVTSVAFTPDGRRLVSAGSDEQVTVWEVQTGRTVGDPLTGQDETLTSIAVAPDGRSAASAAGDGSVVDWSLATGLGAEVTTHRRPAWSVAFSPDGRTIASGGGDGTVLLSRAAAPADPAGSGLYRRLCLVVRRNLTPAEWQRFLTDESYRRTCAPWLDTTR